MTSKIYVFVKLKYPRLLLWMNAPLVAFGFDPVVPKWMFDVDTI